MLLPSNAGLPQNSLDPPSAEEVARTNRALYQNFMASRTGRERVYSTLPPVESFLSEGVGLAKDVQGRLVQSELARRSVLNGLVPLRGGNNATSVAATGMGQTVTVAAPAVSSLNAPTSSPTLPTITAPSSVVSPEHTIMPAPAPIPQNGYYLEPPSSGQALPQMAVQNVPTSIGANGGCGMGSFTPPWSDAFLTVAGSQAAQSQSDPAAPFYALGVILLVAWGLSSLASEDKKAA